VLTGEINDVGSAIMTNVEESYRTGIEIVAETKICDKLQLNINATYSQNKIKDFTEYVDNWDTWGQESKLLGITDIAFSPEIVAAAIVSYQPIKGANISLINKYVSEQYIDNTSSNDRTLDAYLLNHLRLEYGFKTKMISRISVNILINNIFNVEYESNAWVYRYLTGGTEYAMDGYYPQAGRNYLIGLRLEL
jgi:iron complex outermembrane receptor protein